MRTSIETNRKKKGTVGFVSGKFTKRVPWDQAELEPMKLFQ